MSIPYTQPTMANVRAVEGTFISHPFVEDGDTTTKVYNMVCTQRESDYNSAQITLNDTMSSASSAGVLELPFPADSAAYFVGDTNHSPIGGGMVSFTRTFANIPNTITTPSGSQFVTFPGLNNGHLQITAMSMSEATNDTFITTGSPHGLDGAGDKIWIKNLTWIQDDGVNPPTNEVYGDYPTRFVEVTIKDVISTTQFSLFKSWDDTYTLDVQSGEAWNKEQNEYQISTIEMSSTGTVGVKIDTTVTNSINVGDLINVFVNFKVGTNGTFVQTVSSRYPVLAKSGNKIIVDVGLYWAQQDDLVIVGVGRLADTGSARAPQSFNVPTSTTYEYVLPGVELGVPSAEDVNVPQSFRVIDQQTGDIVNTAKNPSVTIIYAVGEVIFVSVRGTIPTSSEYQTMVGSRTNIVIESSISEWAGNILLLKTKTCRAQ